jgi:hypothetical protein
MWRACLLALAGCGFEGPTTAGVTHDAAPRDAPPDTPGPPAVVDFVQCASKSPGNGSMVATKLDDPQAEHDLLVVVIAWINPPAATITSLGDSLGDTFVQLGAPIAESNYTQAVYYASNIHAGANTITVMFDKTTGVPDMRVVEYSGIALNNPLDVSTSSVGASSLEFGTSTVATTHPHDLLLGMNTIGTEVTMAGAGYATRCTLNGDTIEDQIVTATGAYAARATQQVQSSFVMVLGAFKAAD